MQTLIARAESEGPNALFKMDLVMELQQILMQRYSEHDALAHVMKIE